MLRDEQIYLAHKFADPKKYIPPEAQLDDIARAQIKRYKPTDVKLEVWDDLCHVASKQARISITMLKYWKYWKKIDKSLTKPAFEKQQH